MIHGWSFGMLELQPIDCSLLLHIVDMLCRLTLWSKGMKPRIVLDRWHFGMHELQPLYLLATALGSRLAVASNLAVATLAQKATQKVSTEHKFTLIAHTVNTNLQ